MKIGEIINGMEYLGNTDKRTKDRTIIGIYKCHCGKIKEIANTLIRQGKQKSCGCSRMSGKIGEKFNRLKILEISHVKNTHIFVKCLCDCGKICNKKLSGIVSNKIKSCGCLIRETSAKLCKIRSGEKHYKWKKDRTQVSPRNRLLYKSFTKSVFTRDNFICQKCKKSGGNLIAHHLDGYHWCKEKRNNIDNGVTLCYMCHKLFHSYYGYKNNTVIQFQEFIGEVRCQS